MIGSSSPWVIITGRLLARLEVGLPALDRSGMKPLIARIPAGRGRPVPEAERVGHHAALAEAADHGPLPVDAALGEGAVEEAGERCVGWRRRSRGSG